MLYTGTGSNPFRAYPIACLQRELLELGTEEASQGRSLAYIQRRFFNAYQAQNLSLVNRGLLVSFQASPFMEGCLTAGYSIPKRIEIWKFQLRESLAIRRS